MNDESKKLKLFEKEYAIVEHTYSTCDKEIVRAGWIGGFEEMLRIVDENSKPDQCSWEMLLENVRRAILDELGKANDTVHKSFSDYTTRRAWEVVMPTKQGGENYCDCRHDDSCSDKMRDRCASTPNLEREERLKKHDSKDLIMTKKEFNDIYAKYVIRCGRYGNYIGETSDTTFAMRNAGARFTQEQAMKFINDNPFNMKDIEFVIEDAV